MNRIQFYNKLDKFKLELAHASNDDTKYVKKLDKYYPDGTARYFYSWNEWNAYQEGLKQDKWKKEQAEKKKAEQNYNNNKDAAENAEKDKYTSMKNQPTYHKNYDEDAEDREYNSKLSKKYNDEWDEYWNDVTEDVNNTKQKKADYINKNKEAVENAEKDRETKHTENEAARNKRILKRTNYRKNKEAEEGAKKAEEERQNAIREQNEREARNARMEKIKEESKKRAERKDNAKNAQSGREAAIKDAQNRSEENLKKSGARVANAQASREAAIKDAQSRFAENNKKALEQEARRQEELKAAEVQKFQNKSNSEVELLTKEIDDYIRNIAFERGIPFNLDNDVVTLWKAEMQKLDPRFMNDWDGNVQEFLQPWPGVNWTANKALNNATKALENVKKKLIEKSKDVDYDDTLSYKSVAEKIIKEADAAKEMQIRSDIAKARLSLIKCYNGDDDTFVLDENLKKLLVKKLEAIDDDFKDYKGNIYEYVRPYIFGKWIKDDEDYERVDEVLTEIENALNTNNFDDKWYDKYIEKFNNLYTM